MMIVTLLTSFLTAALSAVFGVAGGIFLLAVMLNTVPLSAVIPLHGFAQLCSNSSRVVLMFPKISAQVFLRFCLGLIPATLVAVYVIGSLSEKALKLCMALFVLASVWLPVGKLGELLSHRHSFVLAGFATGFVSMLVGAAGPILSPFFLQSGMKREAIIATQAACQFVQHLVKILMFHKVFGFDFTAWWPWLTGLAICAILGTIAGRYLLQKKLDEASFRRGLKILLTVVGLKILLVDVILVWLPLR